MRKLMAAIGLTVMACGGGGSDAQAAQSAAAAPAAETSTSGGAGTVHEVQMVVTDAGEYRYIPDALTIKAGDTVRWINVSGGPHNVQFKAGQVPDGAEAVLNAAMANRMGSMNGGLIMAPNAVYEIDFTGAPVGQYDYVCTPHVMLGMVATLTIE
jgi:plastocyanin